MIGVRAKARLDALLADPLVVQPLEFLNPPGEETRVVGGAVRNAILGVATADIDLATTLPPDKVISLAIAAGWSAVPTGIEHGTVTLIRDTAAIEVTTLREDIKTDGRHAVVRFGRDFRKDAARRDFTINALSLSRDGVVHDYFHGVADLAKHRVRFIGDADQRLREDYLRGLRFLRFSAAYGGGKLDAAGLDAVIRHREGFEGLSRERVRAEMIKLIEAEHAATVIRLAERDRLITGLLGVSAMPSDFSARLALEGRGGEKRAPCLARLAALAVADEASVVTLRDSLKLTNAEERWLLHLVEVQYQFRVSGISALLMLGPEGADIGAEALRREALGRNNLTLLAELERVLNPPVFLLSGKDILALGVAPSPAVGRLLQATKIAWSKHGFPADEAAQRALLAECVAHAAI